MPGPGEAVSRNIETILRMETAISQRRTPAHRLSDAIGGFVGTPWFATLHLAWFAGWVVANVGLLPHLRPFDPYPFPFLAMFVGFESVFLTTFVLIKQNRMADISNRRSHLDLQINLLTEREVTRLLRVTERLARHLDVDHGNIPSPELAHETEIETLVQSLDERLSSED